MFVETNTRCSAIVGFSVWINNKCVVNSSKKVQRNQTKCFLNLWYGKASVYISTKKPLINAFSKHSAGTSGLERSKGQEKVTNDVTYVYIQTALCCQNTIYVMFRRALSCVVIVRLRTLSSWLPKHKGFARQYARESCYGFRVTSEVISSIDCQNSFLWLRKYELMNNDDWRRD